MFLDRFIKNEYYPLTNDEMQRFEEDSIAIQCNTHSFLHVDIHNAILQGMDDIKADNYKLGASCVNI